MSAKEAVEGVSPLIVLCNDFFILGVQISTGNVELPDCEALQRRVLLLFETLRSRAHEAAIRTTDVEDASYALAAYLDEVIQYSRWPGKQQWARRPLQAILFNETHAGRRFFERLETVRRESEDALMVYYACLVLGFIGEYRDPAVSDRLALLVGDLRRELFKRVPKALSIHGRRPDEGSVIERRLPVVPVATIALATAALAVIVFYWLLSSSLSEAVELLTRIGRG